MLAVVSEVDSIDLKPHLSAAPTSGDVDFRYDVKNDD